ncbi:monooxygenase [Pectobacterium betavasculorum]|uniref:FAD-dependent urate hydroxylase n=1 Tax=Pectobacterium betavasculorum TaxID=55207 RepID=A0A093S7H7_9GAMM|nr:FAD-dependent urate hydroxylase HpxO [Pectobacterium betavasculorum]KFX06051.1 monooxygenase [Pectobacterium betavasculorum]KFX20374.1 monooxygenase [Pectobacterium betavasculorum]
MKATIIGAGIGGLSAAVALKKAGITCEVFEAVRDIKPVGAAISVWPNGVSCMNHLGMGSIMTRFGGQMHYMAYQDYREGQTMTRFSLSPLVEQVGERPYPIARAELQRGMLDFWGRDTVQFGKRVERVEQDEHGVTAWFTDGSHTHSDILIAADGTHSTLRSHVLGYTPERRYAGYVNWNGLVDIDEQIAPDNQWTTFVGEGKRVSLMPVSDGRFYFFFDVPLPQGLPEDRTTVRADLLRYFSGWAPQVQRLIAAINPDTTNRIEIHDIEPFPQLVRGRVALLGDAGHSTTPDIGQGGCAALEDAVVLGEALHHCAAHHADIEAALLHYQSLRSPRVKELVLKARKRCDITHGKDSALTQAWYEELRTETGERIIAGLCDIVRGAPPSVQQ